MFDAHNTINNLNTAVSIPHYHQQLQLVQPRERRYTLVRQVSEHGLTDQALQRSLLQSAYSSPHINQYANTNIETNNIYAEVENDYEIDSGFTEETSERKDESLYTSSSGSSGGASYYQDNHQVTPHNTRKYF